MGKVNSCCWKDVQISSRKKWGYRKIIFCNIFLFHPIMYSKWNFLSRASKHFISVSHVIPQTFFFLREKVCTFKCKLHLGRRHEHQKSSSTVEGNHIRITVYSSLKISPQVKALNKNQTNDKSTCKIKQTKILSKLLSVVEIMKY